MERKNLMSKHNKTKQELILELEELKQKYDSLERVYLSDIESHKKIDKEFFHQQAEELLSKKTEDSGFKIPESDILKLNHELQTHQVELELQNEELLRVTSSLQQNESQYKSLFANNHSVMLLIDPETGEIKDANVAACFYYGWSHGELCKKNISDINTLSSDELAKELQRAKAEKRKHFFFKHCLANGEVRDVEIYSGPIHYGGTTLLYSLVHDITDRKIAEEKLHESEEKYSKAFQTSPYAIGITRLSDGKFLEVNDAFTTISGYSREEILANTVGPDFWVNPEDRNEMTKLLAEGNEVSGKEYQFRNKSGGIITGIFSAQIISLKNEPYMLSSINDISARKRAEDAQHESDALYKAIIHASPDNITITDLEGKVLFSSPKALEMFGFESMDQLINHHLIEFIVPEDRERAQSEIIKMHHGNFSGAADYRAKKADDTIIDIDVNGEFIRDENGTPTRMIFIVRDITERKKTEKALQLSEEKYRSIFETMLDVYYEASLDGVIIDITPSIEIISKGQYTRNELIGKQLAEVYSDIEDQEVFLSEIAKSGKVTDYELLLKNKDRSILQVSISAGLILDKKGYPVKIAGTMRDITERKQTQEALIKNKIRLQQMAEQSGTVIWEIDRTGMYTYVSPVSKQVWEYSPEELVGKKHFYDLHPKEGREEFKLIALQAISKKEIFKELTNQVLTKTNKLIWVSTNGVPVLDDEGNLIGYRGADNDITERKKADDALRESERKFHAIIQSQSEGIGLVDENEVFQFANLAANKIFETDDLVGVSLFDFSPPSEKEKINQQTNIRKDNTSNTYELRILTKKGNDKYILVSASSKFDKNNNYQGAYAVFHDITDRKLAEEKLRLSEEKYRNIFVNAQEGIFQTRLDGSYISVNPALAKMYGFESPEEMMKSRSDISKDAYVDPDGRRNFLKSIEEKGYVKGYEYEVKTKDGRKIWFYEDAKAIKDENGHIQYFEGYVADITDRKLAEQALNDKNNLLTNLIANMQESILLEDADRKIALTNKQFCDMFGIPAPPEALIGADCTSSAEESKHFFKNPEKFIADINLILVNKKAVFNDALELVDGRHFQRDYIPTYIENQYSGHLWKYRDITELKNAEASLKKLSHAIEQSPVMTYITGISGMIEYVNPKMLEITGYSEKELLGQNPRIFGSGERPKEEYKELWQTITSGKEWKGEFHNKKKNRELYWVSSSISAVSDDSGNITHFMAIQEDITNRKQSEKEILELNASLEQKVKDRTAEFKEALNRLNKIADRVPGMVYQYLLRPDGTSCFPYSSEGINDIYRVNPQEVADDASPVFANLHPDDFDGVVESIQASASNLEVWQDEYRVKFDDGTIRWLSGNATPQKEADGSILWHGFITDVTQHKQEEEELALEKQRLDSIIQGTNVGTWEWNIQTGETVFSERWADIIGYTLEEISPVSIETWMKFAHPDDLKQSGELLEQHFKGELDYYSFESRMKHKDGEWIWVLDRGKVNEWDTDGKPLLMSGTHQDITERKQAEEALLLSEIKHSSMISNISDVIGIIGTDGFVTYKSPNIEKYFGWHPNDLIGAEGWHTVHPDDLERIQKEFLTIIQTDNAAITVEYKYKCKDGSYKPIELTATNLINNPIINGVLLNYHDITERKRANEFENELLQLSMQMTGTKSKNIPQAINHALAKIASFLYADRAYIFEFSDDGNTMSNTYECCHDGINPEIENLQDLPVAIFPMWIKTLRNKENIHIHSVKDLPESWTAEREILEPQGIQSLLVIPIVNNNELIGFVGLDSVRSEKKYGESEINNLRVWGNMLAGILNKQRAEVILNQTRHNYETFFNTIDDFLFVLDQQGNIIHTNNTVTNRLGYTTEELMAQSVLMVHPAERREEAGRIVGNMLAGSTEFCPVPLTTKSGEYIPVETRVKHGFWDGKPVILCVTKDVSEVKLSEEKFSKAFQSNSALMSISNLDGSFIDVNDAFLQVLGYTREEVIGNTSEGLHIFEDSEFRNSVVDKLAHKQVIREVEQNIRTKTGELRSGIFSADSIYIGKDLCVLSMMVDITDRKLAEAEMIKARIEAEKANHAKSEFLSRMSHELRTPLNSILGFAQLMALGDMSPLHKRNLNFIYTGGQHLLNLINEVLDISSIEAGKISLSTEPIEIIMVINEIVEALQLQIDGSQISVQFDEYLTQDLFVKGDHVRVKQVLMNLLQNAIKYNKIGGSIFISVDKMPKDISGEIPLRVSIADTGHGMSAEDISKIFVPFERLGAENKETEGTGLGLVVVKKLIDAMDGTIGVESEPEKGSTFWFELPLTEGPTYKKSEFKQVLNPNKMQAEKEFTILYVEDNKSNIELVEQILREQRPNTRLLVDDNGSKAVQMASENQPHLILLDLDLPAMHGSKILQLLRAIEKTKNIPVVVVTADAMPHQQKKLLTLGANNYLPKPLDIINFLAIIDEYLIGNPNEETINNDEQ